MDQLRRFFQSRWDEILIFGFAIQLIVWSVTTGNPYLIAAVTLSMIVMIVLIYAVIERASRRRGLKTVGENIAFQTKRRGLIFTVGRQVDTIKLAITRQKPEWVGLICSKETQPKAGQLLLDTDVPSRQARVWLADPFDVREVHAMTLLALDWLSKSGLSRSEIAVDPTGGTVLMSLGAYTAADERLVDTQYIRSEYDDQNKPIPGSQEGIFIARYTGLFQPPSTDNGLPTTGY